MRNSASKAHGRLPGVCRFEFFKRHQENEKEILRVYRTTALRRRCRRDDHAGGRMAARQLLHRRGSDPGSPPRLPDEVLSAAADDDGRRRRECRATLVLAWLYVAHTQSSVSREALTAMVEGFQESRAPRDRRTLGAAVDHPLRADREPAPHCHPCRAFAQHAPPAPTRSADEIIRLNDAEKSVVILREIEDLVADNTFIAQFLYRLRDGLADIGCGDPLAGKAPRRARGTDLEEVTAVAEQNRLSSGNVTMGNIIKSLRDDRRYGMDASGSRTSQPTRRGVARAARTIPRRSISARATPIATRSRRWPAAPARRS